MLTATLPHPPTHAERHHALPAEILQRDQAVDDRVRLPEHAADQRVRALPALWLFERDFRLEFQAILAQGVGHTVPLFEQQYLQFLGIA